MKKLAERDERAEAAREELNADLAAFQRDGSPADTRVGRLARDCIYGTDKEPRAARTAKMNMIMHGDGHGGIHWHDGLIDINGIWENRFKVVVTNPPFGSSVKKTSKVGDTSATDVPSTPDYSRRQNERYGDAWRPAHREVVRNRGKSILSLYEVGEGRGGSKTEILFLERCLNLLKPGGRLAIVLPNGNLNGASLSWLRRWAEGKAFLRGVVALPMETFKFSGASVSASVVFMQKFTYADTVRWDAAWAEAGAKLGPEFTQRRAEKVASYEADVIDGGDGELKQILSDLRALGGDRVLPELTRTAPAGIERGAGTTTIGPPRWTGPSRGEAAALHRKYAERAADVPAVARALAALKAELAALDREQTKMMWSHVREAFDYPVFMARPAAVGITATGDTGEHVPNDLPEVLAEWKAFIAPFWTDRAA